MDIAWTPKQYERVVENLGHPPTWPPDHTLPFTPRSGPVRSGRTPTRQGFGLGARPAEDRKAA